MSDWADELDKLMTPRELARVILGLTAPELAELNEILRAEGGEAIGVREPRRPLPESPGDELVADPYYDEPE